MDELKYKILKAIEGSEKLNSTLLGVEQLLYHNALEEIVEEDLAANISFSRGGRGNPILVAYTNGARVTSKGRAYIKGFETN
ncbi:hypothetical protein M6D81_11975 [Paenibacillus sp. J5C_2022]|uniref:hypothetical protein n=1 Tax=Paenibacillus sp. J5C2022 TaxID=2977129 RepID=UPI0021CF0B6A|nr:hypothetical protein [Paenibacillus sp. J5C2022]MCU6709423.1 hypothetical protein [Paenibacillus sp. J5C2022]